VRPAHDGPMFPELTSAAWSQEFARLNTSLNRLIIRGFHA
jgi:hypothetical protein